MTKEIRLNAFDMKCVGHIQHGMWTIRAIARPSTTQSNTGRTRLAEKFNGIFLADIAGVYDV